jgi:uracil-DNA glycosylase family 4
MPTYDPRACGARCDECPLGPNGSHRDGPWRPVPPEVHKGATVLAVAEMPGVDDASNERPLSGRSGQEWNLALLAIGRKRNDMDLTHVVACSPGAQQNAWEKMTKALDKENRRRLATGLPALPDPISCCRPRLLSEAQKYENVIALGRAAANALTAKTQSIFALRGGPVWVDEDWSALMETPLANVVPEGAVRKVFPTFHPGFVQKAPGWRATLHADLSKALRWFTGQLRWTEPTRSFNPTPDELEAFLAQDMPFWAYDLETDGIEPMTCKVRSIAIAHPDLNAERRALRPGQEEWLRCGVMGLNLLSGDGVTRYYNEADEARIVATLRRFLSDKTKVKVGHNANSYDRQVVEQWLGITPTPVIDTLFAARFRAPELPKGLKVVGSVLTDVDRWETTEKGESLAHGKVDDWDRLAYNCTDSAVNARIVVPLFDAAEEAGAFRDLPEALRPRGWENRRWDLHEVDHATQDMCVNLHKIGVYVDQEARFKMEMETRASVAKRERNLSELAYAVGLGMLDLKSAGANDESDDTAGVKPGSADQIRDLLYETWKLGIPPSMEARDFYTASGMPGTGDKVLRGHLAGGRLTPEQEAFIRELRLYRREKNKILGTVLLPLNLTAHDPKKGIIWHPDGRVRSTWNAHVTAPGRLSSSGPNLQNIGSRKGQGKLKTLFAAERGHLLVGADLDQAHLRITANYWKIPLLLECFSEGKDPHNTLAYQVFGDKFKDASGWGPDGFSLYKKPGGGMAKAMRDVMKTFRYASIYWADPMTVWQVLTSTESDNGEMPYLHMTSKEVRHFHETWLKNEPEWMTAWESMLSIYRHQGYMEEPVLGRRSGNLSDGKKNEVVNFPILAAETSVMRLAEQALIRRFPWDLWNRTGLIHQCHDSIAIEIEAPPGLAGWKPTKGEALPPELEAYRREVEECMTVRIPGWEVPLTAEASVGRNLKEA